MDEYIDYLITQMTDAQYEQYEEYVERRRKDYVHDMMQARVKRRRHNQTVDWWKQEADRLYQTYATDEI